MSISILGANIKRIREEKDLTKYRLVQLAGVGAATVSEIESGKRQLLQSTTIEKIAKALGVTANDLLSMGEEIEYEVNDLEQTLEMILIDEEVLIGNIEMSKAEKDQFLIGAKALIEMIKKQRGE